MSTAGLVSIGVLILAVGIGLGFLLGYTLRQRELAKASDVQDELNQYRRDVSDHFNQTAVHFQSLGQQYRDLYEHMATGAGTLCDASVTGRELPFTPGAMLPPDVQVDEVAEDVVASSVVEATPEVQSEADDAEEIETDVALDSAVEEPQETVADSADAKNESEPKLAADKEAATDSIDEKRIYH